MADRLSQSNQTIQNINMQLIPKRCATSSLITRSKSLPLCENNSLAYNLVI